MRVALVVVLAACAAPVEECHPPSTGWEPVPGRSVVITSSAECSSGFCLQSQPDASLGSCVRPCEPACPEGTHCFELDRERLCLP